MVILVGYEWDKVERFNKLSRRQEELLATTEYSRHVCKVTTLGLPDLTIMWLGNSIRTPLPSQLIISVHREYG